MSDWNEVPLVFECEGDRLVGILHRAASPEAKLGVVMVVGGPQYRVGSHRQYVLMARGVAEAGFPVMRFDYRGMGDGDGSARDFQSVAGDLQTAISAFDVATGSQLEGVAMFGLCDAASAILINVPILERVSAVAVANPWVRSESGEARSYVQHYYGNRLLQREFWAKVARGEVQVLRSALGYFAALFRSLARTDAPPGFVSGMLSGLRHFSGRVLVLCSGRDLTANEFADLSARDAAWQQVMARPEVLVIRIAKADHTFSRSADLKDAVTELTGWLASISGRVACR